MNDNLIPNNKQIPVQTHSWWKRIGWLIVIWSASVLSLGVVALLLRKLMTAAGMSS